jgi:hypothetical protein
MCPVHILGMDVVQEKDKISYLELDLLCHLVTAGLKAGFA